MGVREHNLESVGEVLATFKIRQTAGTDDLTDADVGKAVTVSGNYEVGPGGNDDVLLGKLIAISPPEAADGNRLATVQIGGVCTLATTAVIPSVGERVVCGANGTVKQAPALVTNDPVGGNTSRGTVLAVNGTTDCTLLLN